MDKQNKDNTKSAEKVNDPAMNSGTDASTKRRSQTSRNGSPNHSDTEQTKRSPKFPPIQATTGINQGKNINEGNMEKANGGGGEKVTAPAPSNSFPIVPTTNAVVSSSSSSSSSLSSSSSSSSSSTSSSLSAARRIDAAEQEA